MCDDGLLQGHEAGRDPDQHRPRRPGRRGRAARRPRPRPAGPRRARRLPDRAPAGRQLVLGPSEGAGQRPHLQLRRRQRSAAATSSSWRTCAATSPRSRCSTRRTRARSGSSPAASWAASLAQSRVGRRPLARAAATSAWAAFEVGAELGRRMQLRDGRRAHHPAFLDVARSSGRCRRRGSGVKARPRARIASARSGATSARISAQPQPIGAVAGGIGAVLAQAPPRRPACRAARR